MSERDEFINSFGDSGDLRSQFETLIAGSETKDRALVRFEQRILEAKEGLTSEWAGHEHLPAAIEEMKKNELNKAWNHYDDEATITGRVYVSRYYSDIVPDEGFEKLENLHNKEDDDNNNFDSYYVENLQFLSKGVDIFVDGDENGITSVNIVYIFSLSTDEEDNEVFIAHPEDLSVHRYETLSSEEVQERLKRQWPEEYGIAESLIKPQHDMSLIQRLSYLAHRLQGSLNSSKEFYELVAEYINTEVEFDINRPYIIKAHSSVDVYDGMDVENIDNYLEWQKIILADPIILLGYAPQIVFTLRDDNSYTAMIIVELFNEENGDEPEYVAIPTQNITSFRSSKALRSLLQSALIFDGAPTYKAPENDFIPHIDEVSILNPEVAGIELPTFKKESPYLKSMELVETIFKEIQDQASIETKKIYGTRERAVQESIEFINTFIKPRLAGADTRINYEYILSGEHVARPKTSERPTDIAPSAWYVHINEDDPFELLMPQDSLRAVLNQVAPDIQVRKDTEGSIIGYSILPLFIGHYRTEAHKPFEYGGVEIVGGHTNYRVVAPLDGSTTIKVAQLQEYHEEIRALETASKTYGKHSVMQKLYNLHSALYGERLGGRPLRKLELISDFDTVLNELKESHINTRPALDAYETLMIGRHMRITGGVLTNPPEGVKTYGSSEEVYGEIIDVDYSESMEGLVLVMNVAGEIKHITISTIKAVSF